MGDLSGCKLGRAGFAASLPHSRQMQAGSSDVCSDAVPTRMPRPLRQPFSSELGCMTGRSCCGGLLACSERQSPLQRQSVGGGKFIQKRLYRRSPLFKNHCLAGEWSFGNPLQGSCLQRETVLSVCRELPREQWLRSNVKQFQGGLVFKAHRLLYHSTLGRE